MGGGKEKATEGFEQVWFEHEEEKYWAKDETRGMLPGAEKKKIWTGMC